MLRKLAPLLVLAVIVTGCSAAATPTPPVVYVTPAPAASPAMPAPAVDATPAPTPNPTAVPTPSTHRLTGTLAIGDHNWGWEKHGDKAVCIGGSGYEDIQEGAQIRIQDGAGAIIGTGSLVDGGTLALVVPSGKTFPDLVGHCTFTFEASVPDAPFYTFKIGKRDAPVFAKADLDAKDWHVDLALGG